MENGAGWPEDDDYLDASSTEDSSLNEEPKEVILVHVALFHRASVQGHSE